MIRRALSAALIATAGFSPALAVGLGPLTISGVTDTERKGFYLTLINPYPAQERFRIYGVEWDSERPVSTILIPINKPLLGPKTQRRLLVIATGLALGEERRFRICAERIEPAGKELIHARVCSKLTARRVA
jgi:hypothetical protein